MKIKTVKKMNVLELAQAVKEGEVERGIYTSVGNELDVYFGSKYLDFECTRGNAVTYRDTFEVETLKELTEDTPINCRLFAVSNCEGYLMPDFPRGVSYNIERVNPISIKIVLSNHPALVEVYSHDKNGRLKQLIWSKENGFEDGVLEVSE